jgi:AcrR family transcriptional regulator
MNAPDTPRQQQPRWTRRKDARPEEISAAALDLFVERGYAGTRLEDVAARAGVSKGTVYLYFASKEDLFKAVVREGLVSPITEFRSAVLEQHQGTSFELLRMLVHGWWERIGATRISGIPKLILAESRNFPEIAKFYLEEVVEPGQAVLEAIVARGIASGEFRRVDPRDTGMLLIAPLLLIALWRNSLGHFQPGGIDAMRVLDAHLEMVRRALAASPVRARKVCS